MRQLILKKIGDFACGDRVAAGSSVLVFLPPPKPLVLPSSLSQDNASGGHGPKPAKSLAKSFVQASPPTLDKRPKPCCGQLWPRLLICL